jgi:OOP family OmpA-OmpF porin
LDRAKAVKAYFASKGIDPARMDVKGYGSENPVADNNTPEGQAQNRRVEVKKTGGDENVHPPLSSYTPPASAMTPEQALPEPDKKEDTPKPEPPKPDVPPPASGL